ncbi:MAG: PTS glucose transporter subunit IIA [Micrococcales bacterium]|nr:PTS glucose transporter subunit IIA [Micrococcales bacterium]
MRVVSPVPGVVRSLSDVPDPVFADLVVGPGVAVEPQHLERITVRAPCDGVVAAVHPHAFVISAAPRTAVLVHVGIDTVTLNGQGFTVFATVGARVTAGDRVLTWSPVGVASAGLSTLCPVIALQAEPGQVLPLVAPGAEVDAGDPVLDWPHQV